jgi:hypothetical protein
MQQQRSSQVQLAQWESQSHKYISWRHGDVKMWENRAGSLTTTPSSTSVEEEG